MKNSIYLENQNLRINELRLKRRIEELETKLKEKEEAIPVTRCCDKLKIKEAIAFEEYLKEQGWEQISSSYVYKQGKNYRDIEDLKKEYLAKYNI